MKAVWSSSGRRYRTKRSTSGSHSSPTSAFGSVVAVGDLRASRDRRRGSRRGRCSGARPGPARRHLGQLGVLDQQGGRIDPDAGGAAVEPEGEDVLELAADVRIVPVQVRLVRREQVEIPLAGRPVGIGRPRPGRSAEVRDPVGRHPSPSAPRPGWNQNRDRSDRAGRRRRGRPGTTGAARRRGSGRRRRSSGSRTRGPRRSAPRPPRASRTPGRSPGSRRRRSRRRPGATRTTA